MPFNSSDAASSCCSKLYQFYAIKFASSAATKLEIAAAKALLFRGSLPCQTAQSGLASEARWGCRGNGISTIWRDGWQHELRKLNCAYWPAWAAATTWQLLPKYDCLYGRIRS